MSGLSFLLSLPTSSVDIFRTILEGTSSGQFTFDIPGLTQSQVHKIITTSKFVASQPPEERIALLEGVGCPNPNAIAQLIETYSPLLVPKTAFHDLRDFDWSTSVVLGTSTISNIKEPIATFRFDFNGNDGGKGKVKSRTIELTKEEAQQLLDQLEAARTAQRELLQK
jgi:hypothetical protein